MDPYFTIALLTVLFVILLIFSQTTRFYFKIVIFAVGSIFVMSILPIPLFILRRRNYQNGLLPARSYEILSKILGIPFELRGTENINRNKGGIFVVNHQSCFDILAVAKLWLYVKKMTTIARKEVFYLFPFGPAAYLMGLIFIDRSNRKSAINKLSEESNKILDGFKILIFPEGTRNSTEKMIPFKKGAFVIAIQTQCVIQPVVVAKYNFFSPKRKYFGRSKNVVSVLPEIDCKGLDMGDIPTLIEKTQKIMQEHFDELNNELRRNSMI